MKQEIAVEDKGLIIEGAQTQQNYNTQKNTNTQQQQVNYNGQQQVNNGGQQQQMSNGGQSHDPFLDQLKDLWFLEIGVPL